MGTITSIQDHHKLNPEAKIAKSPLIAGLFTPEVKAAALEQLKRDLATLCGDIFGEFAFNYRSSDASRVIGIKRMTDLEILELIQRFELKEWIERYNRLISRYLTIGSTPEIGNMLDICGYQLHLLNDAGHELHAGDWAGPEPKPKQLTRRQVLGAKSEDV